MSSNNAKELQDAVKKIKLLKTEFCTIAWGYIIAQNENSQLAIKISLDLFLQIKVKELEAALKNCKDVFSIIQSADDKLEISCGDFSTFVACRSAAAFVPIDCGQSFNSIDPVFNENLKKCEKVIENESTFVFYSNYCFCITKDRTGIMQFKSETVFDTKAFKCSGENLKIAAKLKTSFVSAAVNDFSACLYFNGGNFIFKTEEFLEFESLIKKFLKSIEYGDLKELDKNFIKACSQVYPFCEDNIAVFKRNEITNTNGEKICKYKLNINMPENESLIFDLKSFINCKDFASRISIKNKICCLMSDSMGIAFYLNSLNPGISHEAK